MASSAVDVGRGTTITFGTSSFTAQVRNIEYSGGEREFIETTYLGTTKPNGTSEIGGQTFIQADLADPGQIDFEFHFNPDTYVPLNGPLETITVRWLDSADSPGATWVGSGAFQDIGWENGEANGLRIGRATVKLSGLVTRTAA